MSKELSVDLSMEELLAYIHDPQMPGFHLEWQRKEQLSSFILRTRTALFEAQSQVQTLLSEQAVLVEALKLARQQIVYHHINDPCGGCSAAREHIEPVLSDLPTSANTYREKLVAEAVGKYIDALIWCSGSADFGPGGQAREGWLKLCQPLIDRHLKTLTTKENKSDEEGG